MNEDGLVDIVVASEDAEVLLAKPDGTYESRAVSMPAYASSLAIADFNLDLRPLIFPTPGWAG
jgi:hypothetical protein